MTQNHLRGWSIKGHGLLGTRLGTRFAIGLGIGLSIGWFDAALAIDPITIELLTLPLETPPPETIQPCRSRVDLTVVTETTICQKADLETGLTDPSLWWDQEQFGGALLQGWFAFPGRQGNPGRVDLLVNPEAWSSANYLALYRFINQFGTTAKEFGYNLRVFNPNRELLGAYVCPDKDTCQIFLNPYGRNALRGTASPFGALSPIGGGTRR